jgi:seryl-tRNA synthetase
MYDTERRLMLKYVELFQLYRRQAKVSAEIDALVAQVAALKDAAPKTVAKVASQAAAIAELQSQLAAAQSAVASSAAALPTADAAAVTAATADLQAVVATLAAA